MLAVVRYQFCFIDMIARLPHSAFDAKTLLKPIVIIILIAIISLVAVIDRIVVLIDANCDM